MKTKNRVQKYGRIAVLMGGLSSERSISLKSGEAVYSALKSEGLNVIGIDLDTEDPKKIAWILTANNVDVCFIAMHGRFGEDGTLQEILDKLGIAYTGSGVYASRLAMDKTASRKIFKENGLCVPDYALIDKNDGSVLEKVSRIIGFPVVIKPVNAGSSVGLSIVDKQALLGDAIEKAFIYDSKIIAEKYIPGRELTVGIINGEALTVIEIVPKHRFFDYEAKYTAGLTEYIIPAKLSSELTAKINNAAILAYKSLGCFGCSRIDFILNKEDLNPYVLEVNSIPGFTATSLLPKAAKQKGIEFSKLCLMLIEFALNRYKNKVLLK